jgi:hypothetical protein
MKTVLITFAVKAIMNEHPTSAGRHFLKYCVLVIRVISNDFIGGIKININKRNIKISLVKRLGSNPVNILISCSLNTSP